MSKEPRERCYSCFRAKSSCICNYINPIDTDIEFVILMHPKERQKVRNNTGFMTHLTLKNSTLIEGVDFTCSDKLNAILDTKRCYLLYPDADAQDAKEVDATSIEVVIILDATWPLAKKMLRLSKNLQKLPTLTFSTGATSAYTIKRQPEHYCLSTIECCAELLEVLHVEVDKQRFLRPFIEMVAYQVDTSRCKNVRFS